MRTVIVSLALALVACSKADKPASPRDGVLAAWKGASLPASALAPATVAFGKDCQGGTIEGLDLLLCNFATPAEAKAAQDQGLGWIGAATGASQAHGAALIVLADRRKADPNGRTINRLMKLAPGESAPSSRPEPPASKPGDPPASKPGDPPAAKSGDPAAAKSGDPASSK